MINKVNQAGEAIFTPALKNDTNLINQRFKEVKSTITDAIIKDAESKVIFEKKNITVPNTWSQLAINISAEKYMRKGVDAEDSIYDMITRVTDEVGKSAIAHDYMDSPTAVSFTEALSVLLQNQVFSFNSPVWFNVGVHTNPRISACFILGIEDTMESILDCSKIEGMIYKYGSGSGINYSALRGAGEPLSHGGVSSGPLSFIRSHDGVAAR